MSTVVRRLLARLTLKLLRRVKADVEDPETTTGVRSAMKSQHIRELTIPQSCRRDQAGVDVH